MRSFARYATDVVLYHALGRVKLPWADDERRIRLRGGVELTYRLNRGDLQSIREVWVDECYRPPGSVQPDVVIDLGANIGLTSVYLARRHGSSTVVAVEPAALNCRIAEKNFGRNGVRGKVIEAAVGPTAGPGFFRVDRDSNLGQVAEEGVAISVITMRQILAETPDGCADLVKMDIEGGEGDLLTGDIAWLGSVRSLLAEFHPTVVDYPGLIGVISRAGFTYIPGGTLRPAAVDSFINLAGSYRAVL